MKGIVLAGGTGSRLYPLTLGISKQLLPIFDKPMIYYPLSVLMLAGIKEILIISTPRDLPLISSLLGDGSQWGVCFSYQEQLAPDGIPQAFVLAETFLAGDSACLILGDNLYHGVGFAEMLKTARQKVELNEIGSCVFATLVDDPERYGVVEFDSAMRATRLIEKPANPKSNYAVTGLYFYNKEVVRHAKSLRPSERGELEITDLNQVYLKQKQLSVQLLGRGFAWFDAGTHESLLEASQYISIVECRQALKIGCLEEVAWRMGFISEREVMQQADKMQKTAYAKYLTNLIKSTIDECIQT